MCSCRVLEIDRLLRIGGPQEMQAICEQRCWNSQLRNSMENEFVNRRNIEIDGGMRL